MGELAGEVREFGRSHGVAQTPYAIARFTDTSGSLLHDALAMGDVITGDDGKPRCAWAATGDTAFVRYHDSRSESS
jgi:hypothetical protein